MLLPQSSGYITVLSSQLILEDTKDMIDIYMPPTEITIYKNICSGFPGHSDKQP